MGKYTRGCSRVGVLERGGGVRECIRSACGYHSVTSGRPTVAPSRPPRCSFPRRNRRFHDVRCSQKARYEESK